MSENKTARYGYEYWYWAHDCCSSARNGYRVFAGMRNTAKREALDEAAAGLP